MTLSGMRVLVTGATGFIGSAAARGLAGAGAEVHVLVRPGAPPGRLEDLWPALRRHAGDLADPASLEACLKRAAPEAVLHLAKPRGELPIKAELALTFGLAGALSRFTPGLKRWVRTAHSVRPGYGPGADQRVTEELGRRYGLPVVSLELFSVYGPGQGDGDFPLSLIRDLAEGRKPSLPPDPGVRDFVFVEDAAEAYLRAAAAEEAEGRVLPIGTGVGRTCAEAAAMLLEKLGAAPPGMGLPPRGGASGRSSVADTEPAARALGWRARTGLAEGLDRLIRWGVGGRADELNRKGRFEEALAELGRVERAVPGSPEPHLRAAEIHLDQAQYRQAARRMDRALRLKPREASFHARRAMVHFIGGDVPAALKDAEAALELSPGDLGCLQDVVRLRLLSGRRDALGPLEAPGLPEGLRKFWKGYLRCRQGRYAESAGLFGAAERLLRGPDPDRAARAAFYRLAARALAAAKGPPSSGAAPRSKELLIVGLGYRQPVQATVEALRLLSRCEAIFSNLSEPRVAEFLGLFPVPMKPIVFRRHDPQAERCARDILPAFKRYRRVGVVTRGNPLFYGRLAYRLVVLARRMGIEPRVPPSVSIGEIFPSLVGLPGAAAAGVQVRDSFDLEGLDGRLPLVVYNLPGPGERAGRLAPALRAYPNGHGCFLLAGSGDKEFSPEPAKASELGPRVEAADPAVTLFFPGSPGERA